MSKVNEDFVRDSLRELSDAEYQARAWKGEIPNEMHLFDECVELLFGDSGLSEALAGGTVYSDAIDQEFLDLKQALSEIEPWRPVPEILGDPKLPAVRAMAVALLEKLEQTIWRRS